MKFMAMALGERIEIMHASDDGLSIGSFECSLNDAEKLHSDLEVALRELDELRLKRQAEAEKYMEEG